MTELTVSMPAYNTGEYIGEAIESVLRQEGVDFELIVVDDGSKDDTAEVVLSFNDPRIRLIRNEKNMGIAYCHNLVIEKSASPFIAHVDSDDIVLPGAFRKMVDTLKSSPRIGQAHCHYLSIDKDGKLARDKFGIGKKTSINTGRQDMDYRRELVVRGGVINHLRTYRREVFEVVGKFNEKLKYSEDCEVAIRIIDKYDVKLVPELLYCRRIHKGNTSQSLRFRELRFWWQRVLFCRQLLKNDRIHFLKLKEYNLNRLMIVGSYRALRLMIRRVMSPILTNTYNSIVNLLSWWPMDFFQSIKGKGLFKEKRIAYYVRHYPVLSETFIQREILALRGAGLSVEVVADSPKDLEFLDENAKSFIENTHYLLPMDRKRMLRYNTHFLLTNPLTFLILFLYVITHRYEEYKTFTKDKSLFLKAVYLAGVLKDKNVNHLHSPWADVSAFISLIAAKLLGVSYSVEGRAADIYRRKNLYALPEKFENAEFVVTNTLYNESHIRSMLDKRHEVKIHMIYEGINLEQFKPTRKEENTENRTRIITVGRLVEEKGLVYLLRACKILKNRGYSFRCEIIGGVEKQFTNHYIELMRLHRRLGLEGCVVFLGAQPFIKVLEGYNNADIFILPCVIAKNGGRDISPNALIEAMAMKLPVISTKIAAIPEIVEDGMSGMLVPPNDEYSLVEAMVKLIDNHSLRKQLGENGRKRVEERFDINKNIVKYVDLFKGKFN
jgi:glycosyltransferase involved in cell wall biosynthesis